ncbi:MAG: hypothetical protein WBQ08_07965 [Candidatus Sulfotelmatobacter sp.]
MESKTKTPPQDGLLSGKLVHLALPVRWSLVEERGRGPVEMACTYDIHPRGARLTGSREMKAGDLVLVERGRHKAMCQVVWTGDRSSDLRGQFAVQCVEVGRTPWDDELRQLEEEYQPVILSKLNRQTPRSFGNAGEEHRRRPRYEVHGSAEIDGHQGLSGSVDQLSEFGARISARTSENETLRPGTDFRLLLSVLDVNLALKAQVKYMAGEDSMGVAFQEIRRGDRPLLRYVLNKLRAKRRAVKEFVEVEVVHA